MSAQLQTLTLAEFQSAARGQYLAAALWTESGDDGDAYARAYTTADIAPHSRAIMRAECDEFIAHNWALIQETGQSAEQCGHDFWLTRNGHGVGFWDRGYPVALGDALTRAARIAGSRDLYLGDDGRIWQS